MLSEHSSSQPVMLMPGSTVIWQVPDSTVTSAVSRACTSLAWIVCPPTMIAISTVKTRSARARTSTRHGQISQPGPTADGNRLRANAPIVARAVVPVRYCGESGCGDV
jgi:hypothetical protein